MQLLTHSLSSQESPVFPINYSLTNKRKKTHLLFTLKMFSKKLFTLNISAAPNLLTIDKGY